MNVHENRILATYTTFAIGGAARWFAEVESEAEVAEAVDWAEERGLDLFVLGGGSNLLISDDGFDGLVMRIAVAGLETVPSDRPGEKILRAGAGVEWDRCVDEAVRQNLAGIECLAGIPGTVGGTPVQNVGAYGQEVATAIERVRCYDRTERTWVEFTADACGFGYRESRFNTLNRGRYIVTRVDYRLTEGGEPTLRYGDLQRALAQRKAEAGSLSLVEVAEIVRAVRREKGMCTVAGDADTVSAGSFFKNPVVTEAHAEEIESKAGKQLPRYATGEAGTVKLPAAWLIEQAGFAKGYGCGRAAISSRHTLALTNRGGATAAEVLALADEIKAGVRARFGVELSMEPVRVGF